jgi:hypothetical protein
MPEVQAINQQVASILSPEEVVAFDDALERLRKQAKTMQALRSSMVPKANRYRGRKKPELT